MAALRNGVRCIEHCTLADEEVIDMLVEKKAMITPTRWVIGEFYLRERYFGVISMCVVCHLLSHETPEYDIRTDGTIKAW